MSVKPRLLDVAAATQDVGPEGQVVWMPSGYLTVTGECIASDGVYLLENTRYVRPDLYLVAHVLRMEAIQRFFFTCSSVGMFQLGC